MTAGGDAIDTAAIAAWMSTLDIEVVGPVAFARVGAGHSNLTFLAVDAAGSRWILRRPPHGELLASAHDVAREHRILTALEGTAVPTPGIHGLCTDPAVTDAPLMVMDYVDAYVIGDMAAAEAVPVKRRRQIGASVASTLGLVHAIDLEATGLDSLASHAPYAERQLRRWRRQWELSATRDLPLVADLADRLTAIVPVQREVTLVHGDFHLLNVMTNRDDGKVVAVLDWELCTLGDPLADLGSTLAYWTQADDDPVIGFAGPTLEGFPSRAEFVDLYATATGRDVTDVWFWYVFGLWKIAVISEGVIRRALDDPRNASAEGQVDLTIVDKLLDRADRVLREFSATY